MIERWADPASLALAATGVLVLFLAGARGRHWRAGVPLTMEFWTAAGLLRLVGEPSWARIATAAAIVATRKLLLWRRWSPPT